MARHNELGKMGEDEAARYLKSVGYKIRSRNWKFYGYEIDIVAETDKFIVFVEVKTRTSKQFGNPEDFVGNARMKRMVDAAHHYLIEFDIDKDSRFDIIGIVWDGKSFLLEHIDDAFRPGIS